MPIAYFKQPKYKKGDRSFLKKWLGQICPAIGANFGLHIKVGKVSTTISEDFDAKNSIDNTLYFYIFRTREIVNFLRWCIQNVFNAFYF